MNANDLKKLAAERAVEEIQSGMIIGLGTGSTFRFALEMIAEKLRIGELKNIVCIPSSLRTESEAKHLGIPIITLNELYLSEDEKSAKHTADRRETGKVKREHVLSSCEGSASSIKHQVSSIKRPASGRILDITIDGADEVAIGHPEPGLSGEGSAINLIKGGGGALLREKVIAQNCKRLIIMVDESKLSNQLGEKWPVPVEIIPFAVTVEQKYLESLGAKVSRRKNADGTHYITDENNFILDANFGIIKNVKELSSLLDKRAGIVEHGLFVGMKPKVFCAMNSGNITVIPACRESDNTK